MSSDSCPLAGRAAALTCALALFSSSIAQSQEISLVDVTGGLPGIALTDGQLEVVDFGCTQPGVPVERCFNIINDGTADLILPSYSLDLPAGYSATNWPTRRITPTFQVVVDKSNGGAAADDSTTFLLLEIPPFLSVQRLTIKIPDAIIGTPDQNTPHIKLPPELDISDAIGGLDLTTVDGTTWRCIDIPDLDTMTAGVQNPALDEWGDTVYNPNGDICTEFGGTTWVQGGTERYQQASLRFKRGKLVGNLDEPALSGAVTFGFGFSNFNQVTGIPQNDGDAFGQAGVEVEVILYDSIQDTTQTVTGVFVDTADEFGEFDDDVSTATLTIDPLDVEVAITIPPGESFASVVGEDLCVQLDALTEGIFAGDFSLKNNDAEDAVDENPFNFPITGQVDGTPPTFDVFPTDNPLIFPADSVTCTALVTWDVEISDNNDPAPILEKLAGPDPDTVQGVGNYTVTYRATDACGNVAERSFVLSVRDTEPPILLGILPKRIIRNTAPGETSVIVTYPELAALDLCDPNPEVICTPPSGSEFGLGYTEVCCFARDSSGNVSPSRCFDVIVIEAQPTPAVRTVVPLLERNLEAPGVAGASIRTIAHAYLNERGSALIQGSMAGAGTNNVAVWRDTGTGFQLLSREGDIAPGTGLPIKTYRDVILNDLDFVGLNIALNDTSALTDGAHLADSSGSLELGLLEGAVPPGTTDLFQIAQRPAIDGFGNMLSPAKLLIDGDVGGTVTDKNDTGLWIKPSGGPLAQIAREADPVGGVVGLPAGAEYGQVVPRVVANERGEIAFHAFLKVGPGGISLADNTVVLAGLPTALVVVSQEGELAPGPDPALFQQYNAESINNAGRVAFEATLKTGGGGSVVDSSNNNGIYTNSNGPIQLVAREGDIAPCLGGTTGLFSSFRDIVIVENGDVFFKAFLKGGLVGSHNDGSLWRWRASDQTLHPILREGDPAPSTQGAVFNTLIEFAVSDDGLNAVTATLIPGIGDCEIENNFGLWLDDGTDGLPILRLREGDTLDLTLATGVTVSYLDMDKSTNAFGGSGGHGKVLNDFGEIILKARFDQNTWSAIILPAVP